MYKRIAIFLVKFLKFPPPSWREVAKMGCCCTLAVIDRPHIPSPGGRVDFSYRRRRDEKDGRGTAKCWIREEV